MTSHAQFGEDLAIWGLLGEPSEPGFFVDVGAGDPDVDSVSKMFRLLGWRGVHVEPSPSMSCRLRAACPGDAVVEAAIRSRCGQATFWEYRDAWGLSTCRDGMRARGRSLSPEASFTVPTLTLAALCAEYVRSTPVSWLKVDAEGDDWDVIGSGDWGRWRPRVVVVETEHVGRSGEPVLIDAGYRVAREDGVNTFYAIA